MKKYYCFAGIRLEIEIPDELMYENDRYLEPFRIPFAENPYVFRFETVPELLPPTGKLFANTGALRVYDDGVRYIGSVSGSWEPASAQVFQDCRHHRVLLKESQISTQEGTNTVLNILGA
jgi:hypothetical protein